MAQRRPWGLQIAVKRSKVNDAIICPLNFNTHSHLFQLQQDMANPNEEMAYMPILPQIAGVSRFIDAKQTSRTQLLKQRGSPGLLSFYRFSLKMHS